MAETRRNRRLIEHLDPVTGARTYTDELTGEIVAQDQAAGYITPAPAAEVTETVVTERLAPGQTYVVAGQPVPASQEVVSERTVVGGAPVAPVVATEETAVVTEDPYAERRLASSRIRQVIYLLFSILEALLAIRFILMLLGANPASGFASLIYGITDPFLLPFAGLFGQPAAGGSVIEVNTLVAMIVYPLVAWLLSRLVSLVMGDDRAAVRTRRVDRRIER